MTYSTMLLIAALVISGSACSDEASDLFAQVVANTPALDETRCSYTTTGTTLEGSFEERFTADASVAWQLVTLNGTAPTAEAIDDYADAAEQRERRSHPLAFDMANLAQMDTLEMTAEDADTATFTFLLQSDEEQENQQFIDKMRGLLIISKTELRPQTFVIETTEPFSPAVTFKIKEFRQEMIFQYDETLATSVVVEIKSHFLGKAFIFKTIKDDRIVTLSGYDCG
ncbi:MAG: hypothetical protein O7G86_13340 [Gammaproteobacteria bacterium]|nr:hypothetical protein [Gammaproteobacteria bacterium]